MAKELPTPLVTADHGSNIAQLLAQPAEALVMYMPRSDGIGLAKQQAPFGMFDKHKPAHLAADAYLAFMLVNEAIQKAKSTDVAAVRGALNGLKLDTIVNPVEMRAADHPLVRPWWWCKP